MKNPILFFIFLLLSIVNVADIITSLFSLGAEANPMYLLLGNMWYVLALKILVCGGLWYFYYKNTYTTNFVYYQFVLLGVFGIFAVGLGVYSNIIGILNPAAVAEAALIPAAEKIKSYSYVMLLIYIIPSTLSLVTFMLYEKSKKYVNIIKEDGKLF